MKIVEEKCLDTCVRRNFSFPNSVKTAEREREKKRGGGNFCGQAEMVDGRTGSIER